MLRQRTLREKACCAGVGLHSGRQINLEILPAPENHGINFVRTDLPLHMELRPHVEHVVDTTMATTIGVGVNGSRAVVGTVEHLLAALAGLGIDNARIHLDGPEVPIFDGSAGPLIEMLLKAGTEDQRVPKRYLVINKEVSVENGSSKARIGPGSGMQINCSIDFDHPLIAPAPFQFNLAEDSFAKEIAPARTFGFIEDVEALRKNGLALGGSLDNAIVIDHYRVLNPDGLRFPDEFVRHKILDAIGDMSLFGMPVIGKLRLHRSGHALNTALVREVLSDERAYEIVEPATEEEDRELWAVLEPAESLA